MSEAETPEVKNTESETSSTYGKKSWVKWLVVYLILGLLVYVLVYYFVMKNGSYSQNTYNTSPTATQNQEDGSLNNLEKTTVTLTKNGFEPKTVTIKAGTAVTWVNSSGKTATVNSSPHPVHTDYPPLNLGNFENGESLSLVFENSGTYKYHNHLDSSQFGQVVVE